jgi:hypothetical protein
VIELETVADSAAGALSRIGQDLLGQCRGEDDERREAVDVVLDDRVVQLDKTHQMGVDSTMRRDARRTEGRKVPLLLGIEAERNDLTDVDPEKVCRHRRHHDFVGSIGVGHSALDDGQTVLVEEEAVDAGNRRDIGDRVQTGGAVGTQREGIEGDSRINVSHAGQTGNLACGRGGVVHVGVAEVPVHGHGQIRWIGTGQVGRERRLGATSGGQCPHGDATHQPDQEDEGQIAASSAPEGGPGPVRRDAQILPDHGRTLSNSCAFTLPTLSNRWAGLVVSV